MHKDASKLILLNILSMDKWDGQQKETRGSNQHLLLHRLTVSGHLLLLCGHPRTFTKQSRRLLRVGFWVGFCGDGPVL